MRLVLATLNEGKVKEVRKILEEHLGNCGIDIVPLSSFTSEPPEETGADYRENAYLKALYATEVSGLPAVAEDSGLEVEALRGRPGILSARYGTSDDERIAKLLLELEEAGAKDLMSRKARFVAVVCYLEPGGSPYFFEGDVSGYIAEKPRGKAGFGYDPVFLYEYEIGKLKTFAEIPEIKEKVSHRRKAWEKFAKFLKEKKLKR